MGPYRESLHAIRECKQTSPYPFTEPVPSGRPEAFGGIACAPLTVIQQSWSTPLSHFLEVRKARSMSIDLVRGVRLRDLIVTGFRDRLESVDALSSGA